jgi:prepilin signal peptidase PulO-like enzyme (type II secretory pathway)
MRLSLRQPSGYRQIGAALLLLGPAAIAFAALAPIPAGLMAAWWLLVVIVIRSDVTDFLIPDHASLGIALLGIARAAIETSAAAGQWDWSASADVALAALAHGAMAAAFLWGIGRLFLAIRGIDGLGFGDVKLAGASAIWLTLAQQLIALQLATLLAIAALLVVDRRQPVTASHVLPFGAFLAPSAWLACLLSAAADTWLPGPP